MVKEAEAATVRLIFARYLALGCVARLREDLEQSGVRSKRRILSGGAEQDGCAFGHGALYHLPRNIYRGEIVHKGIVHPGEHQGLPQRTSVVAIFGVTAAKRLLASSSKLNPLST